MKAHVAALGQRARRRRPASALLVDRARLAGQRRLVGAQRARLEQAQVRGDAVAGVEQHHVARHQLARVDLAGTARAQHARRSAPACAQRRAARARRATPARSRAARSAARIATDHGGVGGGADRDRERGSGGEDRDERARELAKRAGGASAPAPTPAARWRRGAPPRRGLGLGEPGRRIGAERYGDLVRRERVPGDAALHAANGSAGRQCARVGVGDRPHRPGLVEPDVLVELVRQRGVEVVALRARSRAGRRRRSRARAAAARARRAPPRASGSRRWRKKAGTLESWHRALVALAVGGADLHHAIGPVPVVRGRDRAVIGAEADQKGARAPKARGRAGRR